jgi:RNase P/RNase MRP subunit p29
MLDRAIFAQRMLTEGGIMIDGSGSMAWTDEDMEMVLSKMPAVTIGRYSGCYKYGTTRTIIGRICILAKKGRFSAHVEAQEENATMGNDVDFEALEMLATWPKPRFWLSDGLVCGGKHDGHSTNPQLVGIDGWISRHGKLVEKCNTFMKQHEILRVPNRQVMLRLLQRQRVTLYGSCITRNPADLDLDFWNDSPQAAVDEYWPAPLRDWPVSFCL